MAEPTPEDKAALKKWKIIILVVIIIVAAIGAYLTGN